MNLTKPGGESPLTPWIVEKRGAKLDVSVLVEWKPYKGSKYYNLLLDGVSVYSGPKTVFQLNNLRETKCYRIAVAAFVQDKKKDLNGINKDGIKTLVSKYIPPTNLKISISSGTIK